MHKKMDNGLTSLQKEFETIEKHNDWNSVYQNIRALSNKIHVSNSLKEGRKQEYRILNRYGDVLPYDDTRVKLKRIACDYINANIVNVLEANRAYILTQGPLENTISQFWLMVWEQNSSAIVMLNKLVEKNHIKCQKYWPDEGSILEMSDVKLSVKLDSEEKYLNYIQRNLILKDLESNSSRKIVQFHYIAWPDFGVPESSKAFIKFLDAIQSSGTLSSIEQPAVIHCSAGIGRSGTFCLVESCLVEFEKLKHIENIQGKLIQLRHYRMGLIQTGDQLRFSYLAILEGAKQLISNSVEKNGVLPNSQEQDDENIEEYEKIEDYEETEESETEDNSSSEEIPPPLPPRSKISINGTKRKLDKSSDEEDEDPPSMITKRWFQVSLGVIIMLFGYFYSRR